MFSSGIGIGIPFGIPLEFSTYKEFYCVRLQAFNVSNSSNIALSFVAVINFGSKVEMFYTRFPWFEPKWKYQYAVHHQFQKMSFPIFCLKRSTWLTWKKKILSYSSRLFNKIKQVYEDSRFLKSNVFVCFISYSFPCVKGQLVSYICHLILTCVEVCFSALLYSTRKLPLTHIGVTVPLCLKDDRQDGEQGNKS